MSLFDIKFLMPVPIQGRAAEDLRFIRRAIERSGTFTAVPGYGGAAMGVVGVVAAVAGTMQPTAERWLASWLTAAAVAFAIGLVAMRRKAAHAGLPLSGGGARRFALGLSAPLAAGAALTAGLVSVGNWSLMPPARALLSGAGAGAGGSVSRPPR